MLISNEKIYIVVPVYKVEPYLRRCVESILNQTYTNWELVLVDDGSPDNCPAICDEYAAKDSRIHVIHQENGGVSAARNTGIHYVQQVSNRQRDWLAFIDSDDYVHPRYLECLYQGTQETGVNICGCGHIRTSLHLEESPPMEHPEYEILSPEAYWCKDRTNAMVVWGKLYKVSCFDNILYPTGVIHEDEFTTYRILFKTDRIALVHVPLYYYYINENSIMHVEWSPKRLAALDAFEEQIVFFRENHLSSACRQSARDLLQHSIKHIMHIRHLSPKYDQLLKDVRCRCRRAFRLYAQEVGLKKAAAYWYEVRIKTPAKRVLDKESIFSFLKLRIKKKLRL